MADSLLLLRDGGVASVPLRNWIRDDATRTAAERRPRTDGADDDRTTTMLLGKQSALRKAAVAYGAVRLLLHSRTAAASANGGDPAAPTTTTTTSAGGEEFGERCAVDNFVVHVSSVRPRDGRREGAGRPWNDVWGVSMISPGLTARLDEPSFLADIADENSPERMGRYLEVVVTASSIPPAPMLPGTGRTVAAAGGGEGGGGSGDCRRLGTLLYELFSGAPPFPPMASDAESKRGNYYGDGGGNDRGGTTTAIGGKRPHHLPRGVVGSSRHGDAREPDRKRPTVRYDKRKGKSYSTLANRARPYAPLQELGLPSSLCLLVQALIDGHEAYSSLEAAGSDIHLLLSDPDCFLFDLGEASGPQCGTTNNAAPQLQIKEGKLYGREREVSLITDAFCRVSSGKNEAIFIGGYSGVGKTSLVRSLTASVDVAGGYVLTRKVDGMSRERPLLDVLSAFDGLAVQIRRRASPRELAEMADGITREFESDFSVLARLLPNVVVLFSHLARPPFATSGGNGSGGASSERVANLHNVCFTLRRFMRIVSSRSRPVVLFLDDLQWAGSTSLELIQALLTDTRGSACFFFIGAYRSNEVGPDHPLLDLMRRLEERGVASSGMHLSGLSREDLNMMISESLGVLPRMCRPLSDAVHAKTEGIPLFGLEFLRSLLDSAVLKYSLRERRWIWDIDKIEAEDVTNSALHLLSAKMTCFPDNLKMALKILSCFGIKADESVLDYISLTSQYPNFWDWLRQAINEGCIQKVGCEIKFVHDKVREAAYGLIPDGEKNQFHYNLGVLLYSASRGTDLGDSVFHIIDQINHGMPELAGGAIPPEDVVVLNYASGARAMARCDHGTARSYFGNALSLVPENHWSGDYEFSLRLFFLSAKAAYSCGDIEEAYELLNEIFEEGRRLEDKLDSYHLYAEILHTCEERDEAFETCRNVLSQLDETIPDSVNARTLNKMVKETGDMLAAMSDADLQGIKEMDSALLRYTLKFYSMSMCVAFWKDPALMPYLACRMARISLDHGVCQDSVFGLVLYAASICQQRKVSEDIREACRIGTVAMSMLGRFADSSEMVSKVNFGYYGFVGVHILPLQECSDKFRKGFEVGISTGESAAFAFYNSMHLMRTALLGGDYLPDLLKETDYHLEVTERFRNKLALPYLTTYRETVSTLIDKGESTGPKRNYAELEEKMCSNALYARRHEETMFLNRTLQAFWLGYAQRCHHYVKKMLEMELIGRHVKLTILFYAALNAFRGVKNNNGNGSKFVTVRNFYQEALSALQTARELSPWNWTNKVHLLEAEMSSHERRARDAESSYAAAIASSRASRYVHEEGLACELAALHHGKAGETHAALHFFRRAKECYARWGSKMKAESVIQQMDAILLAHA